jgi:hypothetical protein
LKELIAENKFFEIVERLDEFQGLDHNTIARELTKAGEGESVSKNLEKFQGLDNEN